MFCSLTYPYELLITSVIVLAAETGLSGNFYLIAAQDFRFHMHVLYVYTRSRN